MELGSSFHGLLQVFALAMTEPTAVTFRALMIGWVFAPRRTVLGIVRCSATTRHHAALRTDSLHEFEKNHLSTPEISPGVRKILQPLEHLIQLAA